MTILFPLILALSGYYLLNKTKIFNGLNILEKLVLVMAGSVSVVNILLVYLGQISPVGIKPIAIIIFILCLISLVFSLKFIIKDVFSLFKSIFKNKIYKILFLLIFALLLKVTVFYILHPIIDPDIISQYLTFARDIAISNRIPNFDSFTLSPVTIPPIGSPMLFSFYYMITGNLQSEGFLLLTYPFFLGIVALSFLISKKLFGKTWFALLSTIVFLSYPLIDTMLLEWILYPDIIAVFLELVIIYFLLFRKQSADKKNNLILAVILGLSAAETLLLKSQSILFFVMMGTLVLLKMKILKHNTFIIGSILTVGVLLFPLTNLLGLKFFRLGNVNVFSSLFLTIPVSLILFFGYKYKKSVMKIRFTSLVIIGLIITLGAYWLLRNNRLYGGLLTASSLGMYKDMALQYQIFVKDTMINIRMGHMQSFNNIALLALPVFGSLFFVPKVIGIVTAIFNKHWNTAVLLVMFWYALVIIYSGFPNERYLFLIFPFLSTLIVYGIKFIDDKISKTISSGKEKLFGLIAVTLFAIFSLSQSIILSWGFGSSLFSASDLRQISNSSNSMVEKYTTSPILEIVRLLNIRIGTFTITDVVPSLMIGMAVSFMILAITFALVKRASLKKVKIYVFIATLLIVSPYFVLIFQMSGGNIKNFPLKMEQKLYNYWGEANTIVPYFREHKDLSATTLVVGPQTGLSYKIFTKVYNIEYSYGFIAISPIIKEDNVEEIYKYFLDRNIKYVVIYEGKDNEAPLKNFEKNTTMYNFIKNQDYFTTEVYPDANNLWRLYKLKNGV